jgi:hypothetical protein
MDRDRRNRAILVVLMTVMAVAVLYSTVISWLANQIRQETRRLAESETRLQQLNDTMRDLADRSLKTDEDARLLKHWKSRLPQGPAYAWLLSELEPVAKTNGVTEFALGQVSSISLSVPADLGFSGVEGMLSGVGAYQQLGRFVADLENAFPFNEVASLNLDAFSAGTGVIAQEEEYPVLGMELKFRGCGYNAVFQ